MTHALSARTRVVALLCIAVMLLAVAPAFASERPRSAEVGDVGRFDSVQQLNEWRGKNAQYRGNFGASAWNADDVVAGQLLVTTDAPGAATTVQRLATGATFASAEFTALAPRVAKVTVEPGTEAAAAAELSAQPGVVAVEPARVFEFSAVPNDEFYDQQWSHQITGAEAAWDINTGSASVKVAVVDSGVNAAHTDLVGQIGEQVDASTGTIEPGPIDNDPCSVGHGTWVSGVVGATGNNVIGVAGVNWAIDILDINTADPEVSCGGPTEVGTIAGIDYATQQGSDIVNLSLGGISDSCSVALQTVIDEANAAGTAVIAASGNHQADFPGEPSVPASCNGAISVGSVGPDTNIAFYSVGNEWLDLVGPGGAASGDPADDVLTTDQEGGYAAVAGTSFSAPYVSGVAALLRAQSPGITTTQIEGVLESTALDLGEAGFDTTYGHGLVQADGALQLVASGDPLPEPEPNPDFPVGDGTTEIFRVSAGTGTTEAIAQAVAASQASFEDQGALWGVVARSDDYADALAGSTLALGVAPVLFSGNTGPLPEPTGAELTRVLEPGSTVYILGGSAALPDTLEAEIVALGFVPQRLEGRVRENTAVAVADEVIEILEANEITFGGIVVANRGNWPDAITAGSLGVQFGFPILLTQEDALHPATEAALTRLDPEVLIIVGGAAVIDGQTMGRAAQAAGVQSNHAIRLAGGSRVDTAIEVATFIETVYDEQFGIAPPFALAINVRRADGYAHALSATPILGLGGGVYIPVEGEAGDALTEATQAYADGLGSTGVLIGDTDIITDEVGEQLQELLPAG